MAPNGQLDKILGVVVNNLEVTNNLDLQPEVRCRELLTTRLEAFTLGHTIVLSKGLIDVIPNEATLASILAHNLAHIVANERVDTRFSFADNVMFPAQLTFRKMFFKHSEKQEQDADEQAKTMMAKSPYKDSLGDVDAFFSTLWEKAPHIRQLLKANLGEPIVREPDFADAESKASGKYASSKIKALPLGSRTRVDPWLNTIEQTAPKANGSHSQNGDLPFEVTPSLSLSEKTESECCSGRSGSPRRFSPRDSSPLSDPGCSTQVKVNSVQECHAQTDSPRRKRSSNLAAKSRRYLTDLAVCIFVRMNECSMYAQSVKQS